VIRKIQRALHLFQLCSAVSRAPFRIRRTPAKKKRIGRQKPANLRAQREHRRRAAHSQASRRLAAARDSSNPGSAISGHPCFRRIGDKIAHRVSRPRACPARRCQSGRARNDSAPVFNGTPWDIHQTYAGCACPRAGQHIRPRTIRPAPASDVAGSANGHPDKIKPRRKGILVNSSWTAFRHSYDRCICARAICRRPCHQWSEHLL